MEFPNNAAADSRTAEVGGMALGGGRWCVATMKGSGDGYTCLGAAGLGAGGGSGIGSGFVSSRRTCFTPGATSFSFESGTDNPGPKTTPRRMVSDVPTRTDRR